MAAVVGWLAGLIGGALALGPRNLHPLLIVPLSVFFGVLAALPVAIVLDVTTRSRRRRGEARRALRHSWRTVRLVLAPVGRFRELVGIARSQNLLHLRYRHQAALASPDLARRVSSVLERAGGMFVKFGQIAATRSDLLPETLTSKLAKLHEGRAVVVKVQRPALEEVVLRDSGQRYH